MNIEVIRDYCLSLPKVTEGFPFDDTTLVFRVADKIFAIIDLLTTDSLVVKCNPQTAIELREKHEEIAGAYHMNKRYWNQINLAGNLSDRFIFQQIRHSYNEVIRKIPRKKTIEQGLFLVDETS